MKTTRTDNELIELFILGKLSEKETRTFQERLENDREFRRKYNLIKTFPEMMSEAGRKESEQKQAENRQQETEKHKRRSSHKYRMIAWITASVIVITGLVLFFILTGRRHEHVNISKKENSVPEVNPLPATKKPIKDTVLVAAIKKEQPVEEVIQKTDIKTSAGPIELLSPADGKKFSRQEMLYFSWTMKTDSFTRFYIIAEGREKVILWRGIRPGIREYTIPGGYLYPGKFYWFVGTKEQKRTFTVTE